MNDALAFIPMDRRQALAHGHDLPEHAVGAALFADISGFTPLTERLARTLGPLRGAEELTRHLFEVFTALITEVHSYRGSVIEFSGDAVTCWFDGDDGVRAAAAALAMQEAMRRLAALPGSSADLSVKVAVALGPVRRFVVGEPQYRLIDVLAGNTLNALAVAERLTRPGEIVIIGRGELEAHLAITEWQPAGEDGERVARVLGLRERLEPDPWPDLPVDTLSDEVVRPWLHGPVYEHLAQGSGQFLAGFRPAAALFLSFQGINYDRDDDAGTKLGAFVDWVQETVGRYEAAIIQLTIGDKGSYLYAAFGAPVIHRDDAARAVAAALELQRLPDHLDFVEAQRIGVAYGQMYTGAYGSATRRTYGVLSRKTNLAARLMGKAGPGGIICDDETYHHAKGRWAFEALPPVHVKGKDEPVAVYSPTGRLAEVEAAEQPLVGRTDEMRRLQELLRTLPHGTGRVVLIGGEAGIGKTRLVSELRRMAHAGRVEVLVGAGQAIERETPYRAWRDIFESFFGLQALPNVDSQLVRVRKIMENLTPERLEDLPLIEDVLNLGLSDTPAVAAFDPELRKARLFELLVALLRARLEAPLLLVLEDAQWLDSLSWEFAVHVSQVLCPETPCLLVVASRASDGENIEDSQIIVGSERLELKPLPPETIEALVTHYLDISPGTLPPDVATLMQERSGGNPFVAKELTRALLDRKLVRVGEGEDGEKRVVGASGIEIGTLLPDTLQGLILSRFDQLPSEQQALLKVAAVIGRTFASSALRATVAHLKVLEEFRPFYLRELTRQDFVHPDVRAQELTYLFNHIITHDVVYETLLFSQRRRVHRAVAGWFETTYRDRPQDFVNIIAHHYSNAAYGTGDTDLVSKAVHYLEAVIDQSTLLGAYREAIRASERILKVLLDGEAWNAKRAETLVRLGSLHEKTSGYAAATEHLQQGLQLARESGNGTVEVDALCKLCLVLTRQGKYAEAKTTGEQALKLAQSQDDISLGIALAHSSLGIIAAYGGDFGAARSHFELGVSVCRELGDRHQTAYLLNNLGLVAIYENELTRAATHLAEAYEAAKGLGNRELMARAQINLGLAAEKGGDYGAAELQYRDSLTIFREIGGQQEAVTLTLNLGDVASAQREWGKAWELFYEAFAEAQALNALPTALLALRGLAALLAERGHFERAAELLGLALRHPASNAEIEQNAEAVLKALETQLTPEGLEGALRRGQALDLSSVTALLAQVENHPS